MCDTGDHSYRYGDMLGGSGIDRMVGELEMLKRFFLGLALFLVMVSPVFAAATWESYSDANHKVICNDYTELHAVIYMSGSGFTKSTHHQVEYYDGEGVMVQLEVTRSLGNGSLSSARTIRDTDAPGDWECRVYDMNEVLIATDTFHVSESAIPEITSVLAGIVVTLLCCGIFIFKRRRVIESSRPPVGKTLGWNS